MAPTESISPEPGVPDQSRVPPMVWVGLVISAAFLIFFFWGTNWAALAEAFRQADYTYVVLAVVVNLLTYPIRVYRWSFLLPPTPASTFRQRFSACVIGFMGNAIFPMRAGEFIRVGMLSARTGIPVAVSLASLVLERLFDLIVVLLALGVVLAVLPGQMGAESAQNLAIAKKAGLVFGLATLGIVLFLVLLRVFPQRMTAFTHGILSILPRGIGQKLKPQVDNVLAGLSVVASIGTLAWVLILSVVHWVVAILGTQICGQAFHLDLSFFGGILIFVFTSLSVAVPQAPGFIGVFQVAAQASLLLLGKPTNVSQGFALVQWAVGIVPVTILGFVAMSVEGLSLNEVRQLRR